MQRYLGKVIVIDVLTWKQFCTNLFSELGVSSFFNAKAPTNGPTLPDNAKAGTLHKCPYCMEYVPA